MSGTANHICNRRDRNLADPALSARDLRRPGTPSHRATSRCQQDAADNGSVGTPNVAAVGNEASISDRLHLSPLAGPLAGPRTVIQSWIGPYLVFLLVVCTALSAPVAPRSAAAFLGIAAFGILLIAPGVIGARLAELLRQRGRTFRLLLVAAAVLAAVRIGLDVVTSTHLPETLLRYTRLVGLGFAGAIVLCAVAVQPQRLLVPVLAVAITVAVVGASIANNMVFSDLNVRDAQHFNRVFLLLCILSFALLFCRPSSTGRRKELAAMGLVSLLFLWAGWESGSDSTILLALATPAVWLCLRGATEATVRTFSYALVLLPLLVPLLIAVSSGWAGELIALNDTFSRRTSASTRWAIWSQSLWLGMERPLLGHGVDALRYADPAITAPTRTGSRPLSSFNHPHNAYLEIFVNFGVLGIAMLTMLLAGISEALSRIRDRAVRIGALSIHAGLCTVIAVSHGVFQSWWVALMLIVVALFVAAQGALPTGSAASPIPSTPSER